MIDAPDRVAPPAATASPTPTDYLHIAGWGRAFSHAPGRIRNDQENASASGAPINAVFYSALENRWATIDEVEESVRLHVLKHMRGPGKRMDE